MSNRRILERIESCKTLGTAYMENKKVVLNKRSKDGSGKANLVDSIESVTWGVLFEIDTQDLDILDTFEGGYDRIRVRVVRPDGDTVEAVTYISTNLTDNPIAYDWYKEIILSGAKEYNLPRNYIEYLEKLPSKPNPVD